MPPNLVVFPPTRLRRYPHMFPLDIAIWERFIDSDGARYNSFSYDVKVGKGTRSPKGVDAAYRSMQRTLSKFRIDAIGNRGDYLEIFEVKPNASAGAIGQVITYVMLFVKQYNEGLPVRGAIVTDRERPDMRSLTEELGIGYYVV